MESFEIVVKSALALSEKKALELRAIKVDELTVLTEYFVFATATSSTHVRALADEVEYQLSLAGKKPDHFEGKGSGWLLLDYGSVIVHVFSRQARDFYGLDRIWEDGTEVNICGYLNQAEEN